MTLQAYSRDVARFVIYEMWMFLNCAESLIDSSFESTGKIDWKVIAKGESWLLHARLLRDFLTNDRGNKKNIVANDFFDKDWNSKTTLEYLGSEATRFRLNGSLAHLSTDRLNYQSSGPWNTHKLTSEVVAAWKDFWATLPNERKEWFKRSVGDVTIDGAVILDLANSTLHEEGDGAEWYDPSESEGE